MNAEPVPAQSGPAQEDGTPEGAAQAAASVAPVQASTQIEVADEADTQAGDISEFAG